MPHVEIDFARRPKGHRGRQLAVALVLVSAGAAVMWFCMNRWQVIDGLRARARQANRELDTLSHPVRVAAQPVAPERAKAINTAINELNVPWPEILQALEESRPKDVALLQIEPNTSRARLRIVAEARTSALLEGYVTTLLKHPPFLHFLPSQQEEVAVDGQTRIRLTFDLDWRQ